MDASTKASILVMEDSLILSRLYGNVLSNAGYYPHLALTLEDARGLLKSGDRFDVFICDIQIGASLSIDFLREMRELLETKGTQVVIVTGSDQYESIAREIGVEFFLYKPIDVGTLESLITQLVSTRKQRVKT